MSLDSRGGPSPGDVLGVALWGGGDALGAAVEWRHSLGGTEEHGGERCGGCLSTCSGPEGRKGKI